MRHKLWREWAAAMRRRFSRSVAHRSAPFEYLRPGILRHLHRHDSSLSMQFQPRIQLFCGGNRREFHSQFRLNARTVQSLYSSPFSFSVHAAETASSPGTIVSLSRYSTVLDGVVRAYRTQVEHLDRRATREFHLFTRVRSITTTARHVRRIEERVTAVSQVVSSAKRGESVAAVLPVSSRTALARESHDVPETVHQAPWLKQALHPPAPELDRLTDHVIRQIDSRMIAWRERMGKI